MDTISTHPAIRKGDSALYGGASLWAVCFRQGKESQEKINVCPHFHLLI